MKPIGDSVYINVLGPFSSGKTEFIKTISEIPVTSVGRRTLMYPLWEETNYVIWFDFGQVATNEHERLFFFGIPGARRPCLFIFNEKDLLWEFLGTIVMVDSSRPETFRESRRILNILRAEGHPYVVAINPHDQPSAWDLDLVERALYKTSNEKFIPCLAFDKESVKQVILELLYQVYVSLEIKI